MTLVAKPLTNVHTVVFVKISRTGSFRGRVHPDFFLDDFHVPFSSSCSHFRGYPHLQDFAGSNEIINTMRSFTKVVEIGLI